MSDPSTWLRRVALGLLLGVLTLAALTARVISEGESELAKSDAAFNRGDLLDAISEARRAAILYAPGAPHVNAAYERLFAIARGAEATGQPEIALKAWDAVRGAALETRHLFSPREDALARANSNLARLRGGTGKGTVSRAEMAKILARDDAPRAPWLLVLGAGFAAFASGLVLAMRRGVESSGRLSARGLAVAGVLIALGVACWTLAVYRA